MPKDNTVQVRLDKVHIQIIDCLQPHFGNSRPEVIRNAVIRWIDENMSKFLELEKIGAIQKLKVERPKE
jgi:hypothetical protein